MILRLLKNVIAFVFIAGVSSAIGQQLSGGGAGGGGGTPGGSNTQLQYNNSSAFGGVTGWTTNGSTQLIGGSGAQVVAPATLGAAAFTFASDLTTGYGWRSAGQLSIIASGSEKFRFGGSNGNDGLGTDVGASNGGRLFIGSGGTADVFIGRGAAAATALFGAPNAAVPTAQIIATQGSRPGTDTNVGGANLTVQAGIGTGTGTLASLILQAPVAVGSGTGAQTSTTGLTIKNGTAITAGYTVSTLPSAHVAGARAHVTDQTTTCAAPGAALTGGGAVTCPVFDNGTTWVGG